MCSRSTVKVGKRWGRVLVNHGDWIYRRWARVLEIHGKTAEDSGRWGAVLEAKVRNESTS